MVRQARVHTPIKQSDQNAPNGCVDMRKLRINDSGKIIAEGFHVNISRVTRAGLFLNRLLKPSHPLDAIAEYQLFRLLKGVNEEKQKLIVTELAYHEFIMPSQVDILLESGKITDTKAREILNGLAAGKRDKAIQEHRSIAPGDI